VGLRGSIGRGTGSCLVRVSYVAPFSAPFSGFCPRLRSLCKGRGRWMSIAGFRDGPSVLASRHHAPWRCRTEGVSTFRTACTPADDADASASPTSLRAAQAHPARRSERETARLVRYPAISPVSPEGDHFPQALSVKAHVLPAPKAPIPPDCHAWQRILRPDGEIVGMGLQGGDDYAADVLKLLGERAADALAANGVLHLSPVMPALSRHPAAPRLRRGRRNVAECLLAARTRGG
jgi:hypothetical protein